MNYDLIAIGTGSAAMSAAHRCRAAGWRVAVVDSRPFGGTCALRGCDPKKVLVTGAEAVDWARRFAAEGVVSSVPSLDWPALQRFKRTFTDPVPASREQELAQAGIACLHGRARFLNANELAVGGEVHTARHFLIAAGAVPAPLDFPGAELLITSEQFLALPALPRRVVFVGGGYISFEFAHVVLRAGAEATILHRDRRPLAQFEPELVGRLVAKSESLGIRVVLDAPVREVERADGGLRVHAGNQVYAADLAVHGAGRVAELADLDLDAAGVQWEARGVRVNEFLQSISNPAIYAAGDAAATTAALTPVAALEGKVAAENLLGGNHATANYAGLASVVFTIPPLAACGVTEAEARRRGVGHRVRHENTGDWYGSRRVAEPYSAFKLILADPGGRILGAHLFGRGAEETINLFALAIRAGLPAAALRDPLFAYPSHAYDLRYMV